MNTITLIFKRSRATTGWAAAAFLFCFFELLFIYGEPAAYVGISGLPVSLYLLLGAFYLIPRLIQLDPPLSSDGFLLARPVDQTRLFFGKMLVLFSTCVFPTLLCWVTAAVLIGLPFGLILSTALLLVIKLMATLLGFVFIASITKKYTEYVMVSISAALVIGAICYALITFENWPAGAFYTAPSFLAAQSVDFRMGLIPVVSLVVICLGAGSCCYLLQRRIATRYINLTAAIAVIVLCMMHAGLFYPVYTAGRVDRPIAEDVISVRNAKIYLKHGEPGDETSEFSQRQVQFIVPTETNEPAHLQQVLRFRQLSLTDKAGNTSSIPAPDRGLLPCLDSQAIEKFVSSKVGREITLLNPYDCPLGTAYQIPSELSKGKSIAKVVAEVVGVDFTLVADYDVPLNDMALSPTLEHPVGVFGNWEQLATSNYWSPLWPSFYEVDLLAPLVNTPVGPVNTASPLYDHWYASPRMYVAYNLETGKAIRFEAISSAANVQTSAFLVRSTRPTFFSKLDIAAEDLKGFAEHGRLMRIFPRINHGFRGAVTLNDVPIYSGINSHY